MENRNKYLTDTYKQFVPILFRYGCKYSICFELVEDCIHDVFFKLCEKEDLSDIINMKSYLMNALKNSLLDIKEKSHGKIESLENSTHNLLIENSIEEYLIETEKFQEQQRRLNNAVNCLTKRQKEVVHLYYIDMLSYNEICLRLGLKNQSVREIISDALKRLRDQLRK